MNLLLLLNKTPCDQASRGQNVSLFQAFVIFISGVRPAIDKAVFFAYHFVYAKVYQDWSSLMSPLKSTILFSTQNPYNFIPPSSLSQNIRTQCPSTIFPRQCMAWCIHAWLVRWLFGYQKICSWHSSLPFNSHSLYRARNNLRALPKIRNEGGRSLSNTNVQRRTRIQATQTFNKGY